MISPASRESWASPRTMSLSATGINCTALLGNNSLILRSNSPYSIFCCSSLPRLG